MRIYIYIYTKHCCTLHFLLLPPEVSEKGESDFPFRSHHPQEFKKPKSPKNQPKAWHPGSGGWVSPNCAMQLPCTCMLTVGHKTYTKHCCTLHFLLLPAEVSEKGESDFPFRSHHLQGFKKPKSPKNQPKAWHPHPLPRAPIWQSGRGEIVGVPKPTVLGPRH